MLLFAACTAEDPPEVEPPAAIAAMVDGVGYAKLQDAVDAAPDGATIEVAPGDQVGGVVTPWGKSLTVRGAGQDVTVLEAHGFGTSVFWSQGPLVLEDLTLEGGMGTAPSEDWDDAMGGGLLATWGAQVARVTFVDNEAEYGGAFAAFGTVTVEDVVMSQNRGRIGSAVYLYGADVTFTRTTITGNAGDVEDDVPLGDAVVFVGGSLEVVDSDIIDNAGEACGALRIGMGPARVEGSRVARNGGTVATGACLASVYDPWEPPPQLVSVGSKWDPPGDPPRVYVEKLGEGFNPEGDFVCGLAGCR